MKEGMCPCFSKTLWKLKCEYNMILHVTPYYSSFDFPPNYFKSVKTIVSSQVVQKGVTGWLWTAGYRLLTLA